jgi:hypothetical protein
MSGYSIVRKIRDLEERCDRLGFIMCSSRHAFHGDVVALIPKDGSLPIYSRDAELFVGTLDQLEVWIRGIVWARDYDRMMFGKSHDKNRERKEQDERNRKLVSILRSGE